MPSDFPRVHPVPMMLGSVSTTEVGHVPPPRSACSCRCVRRVPARHAGRRPVWVRARRAFPLRKHRWSDATLPRRYAWRPCFRAPVVAQPLHRRPQLGMEPAWRLGRRRLSRGIRSRRIGRVGWRLAGRRLGAGLGASWRSPRALRVAERANHLLRCRTDSRRTTGSPVVARRLHRGVYVGLRPSRTVGQSGVPGRVFGLVTAARFLGAFALRALCFDAGGALAVGSRTARPAAFAIRPDARST